MRGRVKVEHSAKRVRGYLDGKTVVDSAAPVLVWEKPYYPTYYFPATDVSAELVPDGTAHSPSRGEAVTYTIMQDERRVEQAALRYLESPIEELRDLVRFEWDALDAWFEEDEEVFVHPRDPYSRIDILPSSKHVRVEVDGVTVAESTSPRLLFETGLPVRYYLPKPHVRMDLLEHTDSVTHCPYKGAAEYWSVRAGGSLHADLAWSYRAPVPESQRAIGLIAFYNEKVDIFVDGERQERPKTHFA
ncbi:MAG: DUF427 domain-containing protein [Pseudonocardiales bacterium]